MSKDTKLLLGFFLLFLLLFLAAMVFLYFKSFPFFTGGS
jgi:hypothetical protein